MSAPCRWHLKRFGDLGVTEIIPRHQQERVAVAVGDPVERLGEDGAKQGRFSASDGLVGVVLAAFGLEPANGTPSPLTASQMIADQIGGQTEKPGPRVGALQLRARPPIKGQPEGLGGRSSPASPARDLQ